MTNAKKSNLTEEQQELVYQEACKLQENHDSYADQRRAMELFQSIFFYKDSDRHVSQTTYRAWEIRWNKRMSALKKWVPLIVAAVVLIVAGIAFALHLRAANAEQRANEEAYAVAEGHIASGEYTLAYEEFQELGDFEDSAARATEARDLLLQSQVEALASVQPGGQVAFGFYKNDLQSDSDRFGLIWRVLAVEDGRALLITNSTVGSRPYDKAGQSAAWETSELRTWLNSDFIDSTFTSEQQALICPVELDNGEANPTEDRCFVLSVEETKQYFPQTTDDDHAANEDRSSGSNWWLRTPTADGTGVQLAWMNGSLFTDGYLPTSQCGVRPAMWVTLN